MGILSMWATAAPITSRAKSSSIYQITRDHSLVEELVEFGAITKEQAKTHPQRNVITRALGSEAEVRSDYF